MMKTILVTVAILIALAPIAGAGDLETAQDFLQSNLNAVFAVLENNDLEIQAKQKEIEAVVTPMFDFPLMAKLSLGKRHWTGLTPENKDRFTELFVKRLRQSYLDKLTAYTDEKVIYGSAVEVDKKVHIPTDLVSKGSKISMLYKLYASQSEWRIYDIEIQGVSLIRSYRSQFNEILKNGTFEDLIAKMEKPLNN
ncbi:MAG: ABC transporter substrate-binding protein [Deltaproteobacteria bacterium]|nr:ABC transporter substrate-binding protein [Deltaproteobacteria bacterium]MBW2486954.1 ABC transporter substrate-binding protein [Deltaproteobacteria bacterium]MBW2517987.1 ABC transporter substrate-binding protein [Deltaproteobacteria bacterium]